MIKPETAITMVYDALGQNKGAKAITELKPVDISGKPFYTLEAIEAAIKANLSPEEFAEREKQKKEKEEAKQAEVTEFKNGVLENSQMLNNQKK